MFQKIAKFFIENSKLTLVLVLVIFISGVGSYFLLPKQYNPTIIVPAFDIKIPAFGLTNDEISKLIISPLENKLMELEGVDEVYGIAGDNYGGVMVKFNVGVDKEKAKIRLIQKINENMFLKPIGVKNPIIKTIDPDELPQIIFAINYMPKLGNTISEKDSYIYLRQIANIVKNSIKNTKNITTIEIIGGIKKDLIIKLDLQKLENYNIDILQVYDILKRNNLDLPVGSINNNLGEKISLGVNGKLNYIKDIKKLIITNDNQKILYLEDIAEINYGVKKFITSSNYGDVNGIYNSVFLGIGKAIGTNSVFITQEIEEKIYKIKKDLPKDINIEIISNEGIKAKQATNMLLLNLIQSIIIVFLVLALFLGVKNAFNTAISIPLTLGMVFVLALLLGENINRITLFALILVLGMLVDDSTVVVENMNRHLNNRYKTGKTKLEAILIAIKEVEVGVILSTITRLFAFGSMFAVGGMMGEYMGPIPKFAIIASITSTLIALTINPWISFNITKNIDNKLNGDNEKKVSNNKESKFKIRKKYLWILEKFLGDDKKTFKRRKIFKYIFWIVLLLVIFLPIKFGVFKARMLPKSNQDQIYVWIDAPRGWGLKKTKEVEKFMYNHLLKRKDKEILNYIDNISSTIGQAYMGEFANLFRGGLNRINENQISVRLNLIPLKEYEKKYGKERISSEEFTILLRPILKNALLEKFPDLKISLLEDPPGPPVKSTFLAKIKGNASNENIQKFFKKVEGEILKISNKQQIVDIINSNSTTYRKINIDLDHESILRANLSVEEIEKSLAIAFDGVLINLRRDLDSFEVNNIILMGNNEQISNQDYLNSFSFTNKNGKKIPLNSISKINYTFVGNEINTDKREEVIYINGEMGNNSLVYPMFELFSILKSKEFLGKDYILKTINPYKIEYIGVNDNKEYIIEWGGEWELTIDTFRDLGIAMLISLFIIYFLLVGQFSSFKTAGIIMITFLLGFFGIFPGFSILYMINNEYFSATSMIGIIALAGIVVGNAILLIDYINLLKNNGLLIKDAILRAGYVRFTPIILTSLTTVFGALTIIGDPVWSGLAWSIIWGLLLSSILTLIVIPIFYYDSNIK